MMKKILLTNDDGLESPGLTTLVSELLRTGRYDLRVVAPEKEQSGVGHCITIHWPLYAEPVTLPEPVSAVPAFRVAGTRSLLRRPECADPAPRCAGLAVRGHAGSVAS